MKTFKKIIFATDFSDNAVSAYRYARHLAQRLNAAIHVVNVYEIPLNPGNPNYIDTMPPVEEMDKLAKMRLARFVSESPDGGDTVVASRIKVTSEAVIGFPADTLIDMSTDPTIDLMILGSTGERGWLDKLFGSVAVKVATDAHCPVLLVPNNAEYKGVHHLLYAASFDSASPKDIHLVLDWTKYFVGEVHFVHVNLPAEKHPKLDTITFKKLLESEHTKVPYAVEAVTAESIPVGIQAYTKDNPIDMLIAVTKHRSFWESITHDSVTKALAWNTHIPMMVLHKDDKLQPPA